MSDDPYVRLAADAEEYVDMLLGDLAEDTVRVAIKGPGRLMSWLGAPLWMEPIVRRFCRGTTAEERAKAGGAILDWMHRTGFDPLARDGRKA